MSERVHAMSLLVVAIVSLVTGVLMGVGMMATSSETPMPEIATPETQSLHDQDAQTCRDLGGVPIRSYTAADGSYRLSDCKFPPIAKAEGGDS